MMLFKVDSQAYWNMSFQVPPRLRESVNNYREAAQSLKTKRVLALCTLARRGTRTSGKQTPRYCWLIPLPRLKEPPIAREMIEKALVLKGEKLREKVANADANISETENALGEEVIDAHRIAQQHDK